MLISFNVIGWYLFILLRVRLFFLNLFYDVIILDNVIFCFIGYFILIEVYIFCVLLLVIYLISFKVFFGFLVYCVIIIFEILICELWLVWFGKLILIVLVYDFCCLFCIILLK